MLQPFTIAQSCPNHGLARRPRAAPDLWGQAGALLQPIVENHPLVDGNRRLGWVATAVFLEISGVEATTDPFRITETLARLVLVP
jgi:prophage maintenance system killer protein